MNRIGKDYRAMSVNGVNTTCVKRLSFEWISWVFNPPWKWLIKFRHPPIFKLIIFRKVNHCNINLEIFFRSLARSSHFIFPYFSFFFSSLNNFSPYFFPNYQFLKLPLLIKTTDIGNEKKTAKSEEVVHKLSFAKIHIWLKLYSLNWFNDISIYSWPFTVDVCSLSSRLIFSQCLLTFKYDLMV